SEQKKSLSDPESGKRKELAKTRRFEALSVSMDTLIFNFLADETKDYVADLDGFKFNQVRDGALDCEYQQPKPEKDQNRGGGAGRQKCRALAVKKWSIVVAAVHGIRRCTRRGRRRRRAPPDRAEEPRRM